MITIAGKKYDLLLTTRATKEIGAKFGGLENLGEELGGMKNLEEGLDTLLWLVELLANQAIQHKNLVEGTKEPLLTLEELEVLTTPADLSEFTEAIGKALKEGVKRSVESEPEKN